MYDKSAGVGKFPACRQIALLKLGGMITDIERELVGADCPVIRVQWFQPGYICQPPVYKGQKYQWLLENKGSISRRTEAYQNVANWVDRGGKSHK